MRQFDGEKIMILKWPAELRKEKKNCFNKNQIKTSQNPALIMVITSFLFKVQVLLKYFYDLIVSLTLSP